MRLLALCSGAGIRLVLWTTLSAAGPWYGFSQTVSPLPPTDSLLKCSPPKDTALDCNDPLVQTLQIPGAPIIPDSSISLIALPATKSIEACGYGTISRSWRLVRAKGTAAETVGPACEQRIALLPATQYRIRFPSDTTLSCAQTHKADTAAYQVIGCDALTVTFSDEKIKVPGQSCFVIYRTHRVINWCEFDGRSAPIRLDRDADQDGRPGDEPLWLTVLSGRRSFLDRDSLPGNGVPNAKGSWTSSSENPALRSGGYWEYQQIIRIIDHTAPMISVAPFTEISGRRADCSADVILQLNIEETCTPEALTFTVTWDRFDDGFPDSVISAAVLGTYPRFRILQRMPFGKHSLKIRVRDLCGNEQERTAVVQVTDGRPPAPKCINSLVVPLSPLPPGADADGDGAADRAALSIRATDLLSSAQLPDCSGPLRYAVHKAELIESGAELPNPNKTAVTLTCDDRPTELLYVYAWDANGNSGYCETFILLQDPGANLCPEIGNGSIAGKVQSAGGEAIEGAKLILKGEKTNLAFSDKNGQYLFEYLRENQDYTLSATLDTSFKEGVTTLDIVMIMRHILGEQRFGSPFQYLAADADLSGSITTLDVIHIRKLVLCLENTFPHKRNFRFLPAGVTFQRPEDALLRNVPESLSVKALHGKILNAVITAIKIGDVTGDALSKTPAPLIIEE
jgi:hypothetical protein